MKWWQKAVVGSLIFTGLITGGVLTMKQRIESSSKSEAEVDARANKLGQATGVIFVIGNIAVWMVIRRRSF